MKKFIVIVTCWLMILMVAVQVNAVSGIEYEIQFDSKTKHTYEIKQKIEEIYSKLVRNVHKESYVVMVLHNKEMFAYKKDMKALWKDNTLVIIEGDGHGDHIQGNLSADQTCIPNVQPKSLLAELFSK